MRNRMNAADFSGDNDDFYFFIFLINFCKKKLFKK